MITEDRLIELEKNELDAKAGKRGAQPLTFETVLGLIALARLGIEYREIKHFKPYLHFCSEWDGLPIDKNDPEFEVCTCFSKNASLQEPE